MPRSCSFRRRCPATIRPVARRASSSARSPPRAARRRRRPTSARRSTPAPARASHRPRRHRRPVADGASVPPGRCAPGAGGADTAARAERRADPPPPRGAARAGRYPALAARRPQRAPRPTPRSAATCYHPLGPDGVRPYADFTGEAVTATVRAWRAAPRPSRGSPTTPNGQAGATSTWPGACPRPTLSAQFKYGSVFYGQMDRNWGPVGIEGIGLSNYGYPETSSRSRSGSTRCACSRLARSLEDARDSTGAAGAPLLLRPPPRRPPVGPAPSSDCGRRRCSRAWTASSTAATATRSPCSSSPTSTGSAPTGTCCSASTDATASARRTTVEAQVGIDDLQYENPTGADRYPNRWALTLAALRAARPAPQLARALHPGVESRLPHAGPVRELHRRRRGPRAQLRRQGPA